ncbi:restriction endonuclease subunit S [Desulfuromonas carbonis]
MSQWPTALLGEVCQIVGGGTPTRTNPEFFGGDVLWATPTDVTALEGLYISQTKETVTPLGLQKSSARLLPECSVLLTSRATIGFTAIATKPISTNQGFANFICGDRVLPEFLAYWLPTQKDLMLREAGGTTFKEISKGALKKFRIPLPPLDEQRRIVNILKRADSIRRLRKQALETTRELIPALFVDMFGDPATNPKGWETQPLGDVVEFRSGGTPSKQRPEFWDGLIPWVSPKDMKSDNICDAIDHISQKALEETTLKEIPPESVLIVVRGMILAHTVPIYSNVSMVTINQDMKAMVPKSQLVGKYLRWALQCQHGYLLSKVSSSAHGTKKIDMDILQELCLPIPPLTQQQTFAQKASAIHSIGSQHVEHEKRTAELMQSLMSEFFT